MPMHDWTKVDPGIFHDFHQRWIVAISNALNSGLLPGDYYAMTEQVTSGPIPDVVTLERIARANDHLTASYRASDEAAADNTLTLVDSPPKTRYQHAVDVEVYAGKATQVVIRHTSGDRVVAYIEIVSPGNKHSSAALSSFIDKLGQALRSGIHLLVIDVHPPTRRDPRGIHAYFWNASFGDESAPGVDDQFPLGMSAYCSTLRPMAFFEPFAVGDTLIDMPIFLNADSYINVPLESTYQHAWNDVPRRWREVIQ